MGLGKAFVRNQGESDRRWFLGGGLHEWMATADDTNGSMFVFEDLLDGGKLTPLHLHPNADEAGYLLEGEIEIYQDGELRRVRAGGFYFTPRGMPHAFRGIAARTRLLSIQTPGAGDQFYLGASRLVGADVTDGEVDFEAVGKAAEATGATVLLGPPPFEAD